MASLHEGGIQTNPANIPNSLQEKLLQQVRPSLPHEQITGLIAKIPTEPELFGIVFEDYYGPATHLAERLLRGVGDTQIAEDVAQKCLIRVFDSIVAGKYKEQGTFSAYVSRAVRNAVIDIFRRDKGDIPMSVFEPDEDGVTSQELDKKQIENVGENPVLDSVLQTEASETLNDLIAALVPTQKEVLLLQKEGYSDNEIASKLGIDKVTLRSRRLRAMRIMTSNHKKRELEY